MNNIALGIEYDGSAFYGWQRQDNVPTVQAQLEDALSSIADERIVVNCAGRTDAGVHATQQVVNFKTSVERPENAWLLGVNAHLPDTISVKWTTPVEADFHARFSATARRYRYIIYNARTRPGILTSGVTHWHKPLDAQRMHEAAQALLGEQDFSAFRASLCQSNTPFRNVHFVNVSRQGPYVIVDIQANAFLHHMVRNIVGSLLVVGSDEAPVEWMHTLLINKDRTQAAATAKAHGLYFVDVIYPSSFGLPQSALGPLFLSV
jgi:tRNA pseudouridine38-40 synthase